MIQNIQNDLLYGDTKNKLDSMNAIFSAKERQAAWQLLGNQENLFFLEQEQLLTLYFREKVALEVNFEQELVNVIHDENMTEEQAISILTDDWEERAYSLRQSIDMVMERFKEIDIELEPDLETEKEEETEIEPEETEEPELFWEEDVKEEVVKRKKTKLSEVAKEDNTILYSEDVVHASNQSKSKLDINQDIFSAIQNGNVTCKEIPSDFSTFNSLKEESILNPDIVLNGIPAGNMSQPKDAWFDANGASKLNEEGKRVEKSEEKGGDDIQKDMTLTADEKGASANSVSEEKRVEERLREEEKEEAWKYRYTKEQGHILSNQGQSAVHIVKQHLENEIDRNSHDSYTYEGAKTFATFMAPTGAVSDYLTYSNIIQSMKKEEEFCMEITGRVEEAVNEGKLSFNILSGDKKEIRTVLKEAGFSYAAQTNALKNITDHVAKIELRNDLLHAVERGEIRLSEKQTELLKSENFFCKQNLKEYHEILKIAGRYTSNPILNEKGIYGMSKKDLKDFLSKSEQYLKLTKLPTLSKAQQTEIMQLSKYRITNVEQYIIKEALFQKKFRPLQKAKGSIKGIVNRFKRIGNTVLESESDYTHDGYRQIKRYFDVGRKSIKIAGPRLVRLAKSTVKRTAFVTTIPGRIVTTVKGGNGFLGYRAVKNPSGKFVKYRFVDTYDSVYKKAGRLVKHQKEVIANSKKAALKRAKSKLANTKVGKYSHKTVGKIKNSKIIRGGKTVKKVAKKGVRKIAESKLASLLKIPFKFIANIFSVVGKIKMALVMYVLYPILSVIMIYVLILIAYLAVTAIGNWITDSYDKIIYIEQDDITAIAQEVQRYDQERYIEALDIAYNPVCQYSDDTVFGGYQIDYYGINKEGIHEEIVDTGSIYGEKTYTIDEKKYLYTGELEGKGYHIYYINSEGELIGRTTNNLKDCISAAVVMLNNSTLDENGVAYVSDITKQLYKKLNPELTLVQSPIYYDDCGCHFYPESGLEPLSYACNDVNVYNKYYELKSQNVYFFDELVEQTANGCKWKSVCNGHEDEQDPDDIPSSGDEYIVTNYCSTTYGTVEGGYQAVCDNCHAEYYCDGDHEAVKMCAGHKNINVYCTVLNYEDIIHSVNGIIEYKVPSEYTEDGLVSAFETKTTDINVSGNWGVNYQTFLDNGAWNSDESIRMIKGYVEQDWYELYGIEVGNIIGYIDGKTLTTEEFNEIMDNIGVSGISAEMVETALGYVGRIPYNWGGKPTSGDAGGIPSTGLDCSGFVSLVYWEVTGNKPSGMGTANFLQAVGASRIKYSDLQPGDIVLKTLPGNAKNHIGIYAGKNAEGIDIFIHCNGTDDNVSCNNWNGWKYYYRIF